MKVADLMTREVLTCGANDDLQLPAKIMWESDCGCVPVVDADRHVVGIITDRDICMAAYTQGRSLAEIRVGSAMATSVHGCSPTDSLAAAEKIMAEARVRRLPVVNGEGELVGVLSMRDIASRSAKLNAARLGRLLAAINVPPTAEAATESAA